VVVKAKKITKLQQISEREVGLKAGAKGKKRAAPPGGVVAAVKKGKL
jgi:hypothetical protein